MKNDLIGIFAQHKVAANLLMLMMVLSGVFALGQLNKQFFPTFALDFITVRVEWSGASAEDVGTSITTPIERELRGLDGLREMTSTSAEGVSSVTLEFEEGTDMGIALDEAAAAMATAYAPFSDFQVGAAVLLEDGQIVRGSNQENASFPEGLCAERVALFAMGARHPGKAPVAIALVTSKLDEGWVSPCGGCRQVMAEYEQEFLDANQDRLAEFKAEE